MEKASRKVQLSEIRGSCVAVDTYCWLHKGAFACADKIARKEETDIHIQYCLKYVTLLLSHNIKPILVFDGKHLAAKALTENKRRESRQAAKAKAAELLRDGKTEEARSFLRRSVNITHKMAFRLIQVCRQRNVDCVVAPYEADAQLAFLNTSGIAQYVITEDSDLVLFGTKNIIFKLDLSGNGLLVEADKLHLTMGLREDKYTLTKFRQMCILSGCDYLDSLPGIGLAKACKFVTKTEDPDIKRALAKLPSYLNMRDLTVPEEYKNSFLIAEATFNHMFVYNVQERRLVRLNDPSESGTDLKLCCNAGEVIEEKIAFHLALGNIDPFTMEQLDDWTPDDPESGAPLSKSKSWGSHSVAKHPSIWQPNFKGHRAAGNKQKIETFTKTIHIKTTVEEVDEGPSFSAEDLLLTYCQENSPPSKRRCTQTPPRSQPAISRRNPFAKTPTIDNEDEESPTKITDKTSSLVRNVSPVKRNPSIFARKLEKLSKFNRTQVDEKLKVVSRFFSSQMTVPETVTPTSVSPVLETPPRPPKVSVLEEQPASNDSAEDSKDEQDKMLKATTAYLQSPEAIRHDRGDVTPKKHQQTSPSPVRIEQSSKLEAINDDVIDCDAYEVSNPTVRLPIGKSSNLLRQQQFSNRCRVSGLMKSKKGAAKAAVTNQATLSMFGFQKK
jgi:exonuclease 1